MKWWGYINAFTRGAQILLLPWWSHYLCHYLLQIHWYCTLQTAKPRSMQVCLFLKWMTWAEKKMNINGNGPARVHALLLQFCCHIGWKELVHLICCQKKKSDSWWAAGFLVKTLSSFFNLGISQLSQNLYREILLFCAQRLKAAKVRYV